MAFFNEHFNISLSWNDIPYHLHILYEALYCDPCHRLCWWRLNVSSGRYGKKTQIYFCTMRFFYKFYYIRYSTVYNAIEPISTEDWRNLSFNNQLKTLCMKMWNAFKSCRCQVHEEIFFSSSTATILRHLSRTWCDCWWQLYFFLFI